MKHFMQNRKVRLAAGLTAATLAFGAAAPTALAQAETGDEAFFGDASQVQTATAVQTGDANAAADDGSVALASNDLTIEQSQFNAGFGDDFFEGDFDGDGIEDGFDEDDDNDGVFDHFE